MKPKEPVSLPPIPEPLPWACASCKFGKRFVDYPEVDEDNEDKDWKGEKRKFIEGYYCSNPYLMEQGGYVETVARLFCELREPKEV